MSKYNEQRATTMLNALQGTDTLKQYAEQIRADERAKVLDEVLDEVAFEEKWLSDDYNIDVAFSCIKSSLRKMKGEQNE